MAPLSRLGNVGLVDWFESAIHPCLHESIYQLQPMPSTWAEWKSKASLLDNQWQWFQAMQPCPLLQKMAPFHCPPQMAPLITHWSTPPASSSGPQPMELDHVQQTGRDPCQGLCFNCGKPGHIAQVCWEPHVQRIQVMGSDYMPRLTPDDLQTIVKTIQATMAPAEPLVTEKEDKNSCKEGGF